jgi:CheY-like chemotaxis protein
MVIKLLIADPDITFAIGIKRALEQTGEFVVTAFGTGSAALEHLQSTPQDAVLLDLSLSDQDISTLIAQLRGVQAGVAILVSPRTAEQIQRLGALKVQGSIPKPYYARQLVPLVRDAITATRSTIIPNTPPPVKAEPPAPTISVSPDFDAAIAALPTLIEEPPIAPDDTFRRHLATMLPEKPATPAGLKKTLESVDLSESKLSDDATIADVVHGKPLTDPPETPKVPEPETPTISEVALDALETIPTGRFTLDQFAEQVEQTTGMPLPDWVRETTPEVSTETPSTNTTDPVAQVATTLTQLSTGATTRAILLTRGGEVVAAAGELRGADASSAANLIENAWQKGDNKGNTLLSYLSVPGFGDFLLYSTETIEGMRLSMFFPAETTMRAVRKHARQLLDALVKSEMPASIPPGMVAPERPKPDTTEKLATDDTLPDRPTQPRPPAGLKEVAPSTVPADAPLEQVAPEPIALTAYSILWTPRAGVFDPEIQPMLNLWLTEACLEHHYELESVQTQPGFLTFELRIPATEAPNTAISRLMDATAARTGNPDLWTDGYYIATPARPITRQEIAAFLGYPRQ